MNSDIFPYLLSFVKIHFVSKERATSSLLWTYFRNNKPISLFNFFPQIVHSIFSAIYTTPFKPKLNYSQQGFSKHDSTSTNVVICLNNHIPNYAEKKLWIFFLILSFFTKDKSKVVPIEGPLRCIGGEELHLHSFFTSAWLASPLGRFYPEGKSKLYQLNRRLGRPRNGLDDFERYNICPCRHSDPGPPGPQPNHCTYYCIQAHTFLFIDSAILGFHLLMLIGFVVD